MEREGGNHEPARIGRYDPGGRGTGHPRPDRLRLHVEDALASAGRLWVRGRLSPASAAKTAGDARWWESLVEENRCPTRRANSAAGNAGERPVLTEQVPLRPDGRFEATFTAELPPARRGWRMTRNRFVHRGDTAERCGVAVLPPSDAQTAVVVFLPLACTYDLGGAQKLVGSELASRLTPVLARIQQLSGPPHVLYYLACVPIEEGSRQTELALAATTLGWPQGHFVLLPAEPNNQQQAFADGLDRLRWLLADSLNLLVLNQEPTLSLAGKLEPQADRAPGAGVCDRG